MILIDDDFSAMSWKDIAVLNRMLIERLIQVEMAMLSTEMIAIREMEADIPPDPRADKIRDNVEGRLEFAEYLIQQLGYDPAKA